MDTNTADTRRLTFGADGLAEVRLALHDAGVEIEVQRGEAREVVLDLQDGAEVSERVRVERAGHALTIVQAPGEHGRALRLALTLPAALPAPALDLAAGTGKVRLSDLGGTITARLVVGEVALDRCGGECTIEVGEGAVAARDCTGRLRLQGGMKRLRRYLDEGEDGAAWPRGAHHGHGRTRPVDIIISGFAGEELEVHNEAGEIRVEGGTVDRLSIHNGAGNLRCRGLQRGGGIELHTGAGNISLVSGSAGRLHVSTGAGNVDCAMPLDAGHHALETGAGNIVASLPEGASVHVEAHTGIGTLHSDFPVLRSRSGFMIGLGGRITGEIGTGATPAMLRLHTGVGNVSIRRTPPSPASGAPTAATEPASAQPGTAQPADAGAAPRSRMEVLQQLERGEIKVDEALALLKGAG